MKRLGLALVSIICLGLALAQAQDQTNPTVVGTTGAYNSSPPTCTNGNWCTIQTDVNGKLLTSSTSTVTGTVAIDQTTPGTTNGVVVNSGGAIGEVQASPTANTVLDRLKSLLTGIVLSNGSAVIGKVGIDQTTPGTTNGVVAGASSAIIGKVGIDQTTPGTTNAVVPAGNVASAAADSGNPIKVGAVYNSTPPTFTTGQRGDAQLDASGNLRTGIAGVSNTTSDGIGAVAAFPYVTNSQSTSRVLGVLDYIFNGATLDRTFTCPSTVAVSVTAGNTTQLVALSGSTIIRVCSFAITESLAGTAQFVYGTGSNCGTGTTNITGAMSLATSGVMSMAAGNGSVFRAAASNALCLAAVTGNITGFVTYAQY